MGIQINKKCGSNTFFFQSIGMRENKKIYEQYKTYIYIVNQDYLLFVINLSLMHIINMNFLKSYFLCMA